MSVGASLSYLSNLFCTSRADLLHASAPLRPTHLIGQGSLHRTHLGPHDTITCITSTPSQTSSPHGEPCPQPENLTMGSSSPTGTFLMSFSSPRTPSPTPQVYTITCLNGIVRLTGGGPKWTVEVISEDADVLAAAGQAGKQGGESFESVGVKEEVRQFAESALGRNKQDAVNRAEPRDALWDVAFIQAALTSEGKSVELGKQ